MPNCEADLPLATPLWQRTLDLDALSDQGEASALMANLSALAAHQGRLWLGGDEGRRLYHLQRKGEHDYGNATSINLENFGLAGGDEDRESDIEGLALDGQRLWIVGSHSLRRRKPESDRGPLTLHDQAKQSRNCHALGCLRLDGEGQPQAGQRLAFNHGVALPPQAGSDELTRALAADPRIAPFLAIPSKENGLDIEGLAARDDRVLVGLRGPVLRGIALVLDLHLAGVENDSPILNLAQLHFRYLDLAGLAVRDLARVPESDDALILAGPTMTLAGPSYLYLWRHAFGSGQGDGAAPVLTVERPEPLLWIRDGRPARGSDDPSQSEGSDKPEGLEVQRHEDRLLAWVAYDDPTRLRRGNWGAGGDQVPSKIRTRLDGFALSL